MPTLQAAKEQVGPLPERANVNLDRGYDSDKTRTALTALGVTAEIARKGVPAPIQAGFYLYLSAAIVTLRMLIRRATPCNAARGAISLRVNVQGREAHVGQANRGVNAFQHMLHLARPIERYAAEMAQRHTVFPPIPRRRYTSECPHQALDVHKVLSSRLSADGLPQAADDSIGGNAQRS